MSDRPRRRRASARRPVSRGRCSACSLPRRRRRLGGGDYGTHAAHDFEHTAEYRGAIRAGYRSRTVHERRQIAAAAQRRIHAGHGTVADHVVVHEHKTRIAGNRKRAALAKAFNVLDPSATPEKLAKVDTTERGLHLAPGYSKPGKPTQKGSILTAAKGLAGAIRAVGEASSKGYASVHAPKILQNAPKDIADLVITTPSSLAKLGMRRRAPPAEGPGRARGPVRQLASTRASSSREHPVSTL
jgi:hypothetical protein